jgi:hypothetical protein
MCDAGTPRPPYSRRDLKNEARALFVACFGPFRPKRFKACDDPLFVEYFLPGLGLSLVVWIDELDGALCFNGSYDSDDGSAYFGNNCESLFSLRCKPCPGWAKCWYRRNFSSKYKHGVCAEGM